jgi:uncharacterized protein with von Willebrand factor type A (vWA) domain
MNKNRSYKNVKIDFGIPAYDINQQGLIIDLRLLSTSCSQFRVKAVGSIAKSLESSFIRVIEIMSSLKASWSFLARYQYTLISFSEHYKVKDTRSADLSLCIAALNVVRNYNQQKSVDSYIGTGTLRVDGSFSQTSLEEVKEKAVLESHIPPKRFINAQHCEHIFDLDALLNRF